MAGELKKKKRYQARHQSLILERSSWLRHWLDIASYTLPRRQRYDAESNTQRGNKQNNKINNNTATRAARILASGMMAGITSPAKKWFRLVHPDPQMMESGAVKAYYSELEKRCMFILSRSNFYRALSTMYLDLGVFGVSPLLIEEDDEDIIRCKVYPVGSYCLAQDHKGRINCIYYQARLSTEQMVLKFGLENLSTTVQRSWKKGNNDELHSVIYAIEENLDRENGKADSKGMKYRSIWYEDAGPNQDILAEGGFNEFPVIAPRWSTVGEDVYAECPGMDALPDNKGLQHLERRVLQAIGKIVAPPMKAPAAMREQRISLVEGDVSYYEGDGGVFEPAYVVDPRAIPVTEDKIRLHEQRINSTFMADLMLMVANSPRATKTAREVDELHEEKMLQLGPVLEGLEDNLDRVFDRLIGIMTRGLLMPEAPEILEGSEIQVEYMGMLSQAQKLIGVAGIERGMAFITEMSQFDPSIMDKADLDQAVDMYWEMVGADQSIIRPDDQVAKIRAERAEAEKAQQMMENAPGVNQLAQATRSLSESEIGGQPALDALQEAVSR
jgi:hypothetical protein